MIYDGNVAVTAAGTRQRLVPLTSPRIVAAWITFQPQNSAAGVPTNTGPVVIGGSDVTFAKGFVIQNGDSAVAWPVSDINGYDLHEIWVDATVNGEGVQYIYFTR